MKVKKQLFKIRVLTIIIILACILHFTCKPYEGGEETEYENTNVVYSEDGNSITIYLDGNVPASRALSRPIAMMGCDYFEVDFLDNNGVLTRAEWMAGKIAYISGLTTGINYGNIAPVTGQGSAILFAGKSDKTLMAVGHLTAVDGAVGTTTIAAGSKTVTFTLNALVAGVSSVAANSSFLTAAKDTATNYTAVSTTNTAVSLESIFHTVPEKEFPCFEMERFKLISATYTFKITTDVAPYNSLGNYEILVSPPAFAAPGLPVNPVEKKIPRYTSSGLAHESIVQQDEKTIVILDNNIMPDIRFVPGVNFTFNTADTISGSFFSLVFSVPVYALSDTDKDGNKSRWYIRSSYGPNLYDLDDGTSGMGGAVLFRTGTVQVAEFDDIKILITHQPSKYQYPLTGNTWQTDRVFDISNLVVELRRDDGTNGGDGTYIRTLMYDELEFVIGRTEVSARWQSTSPSSSPPYFTFASNFWGIIEVTVRYRHSTGKIVDASFYVLVSGNSYNLANWGRIVHIYDNSSNGGTNSTWETANTSAGLATVGTAHERFNDLINHAPAGTSTLVVFHNSFDMSGMVLNQSGNAAPRLFFMVAGIEWNTAGSGSVMATSNITIGRGSAGTGTDPFFNIGNSIVHNITNPPGMNGINAYYFGVWPFDGLAPGNNQTYPYTVNTRNTCSNSAYLYDNKMLTDGFLWNSSPKSDGGIYNVKVGPGVNVRPTETIQVMYQGTMENIDTYPYLH